MLLVGLLDASAYTVYCLGGWWVGGRGGMLGLAVHSSADCSVGLLSGSHFSPPALLTCSRSIPTLPSFPRAGFFACGATLANLLLSGVGQVLTASLTRWVLRRRLTGGQLAGIAFVSLGLAVRAAPAAYFDALPFPGGGAGAAGSAGPAGPSLALSPEQLTGAGMVALAAFLYSLLGVAYEKLLKGTGTPPPNAEIMWNVSILGGWGAGGWGWGQWAAMPRSHLPSREREACELWLPSSLCLCRCPPCPLSAPPHVVFRQASWRPPPTKPSTPCPTGTNWWRRRWPPAVRTHTS